MSFQPFYRPLIILYGDDKTEEAFRLDAGGGWAAGLAEIYSRKADIIVRGYKGYTAESAVTMLDKIAIPAGHFTKPAAIVVSFGSNDKAVLEYKENIEKIVNTLKEEHPDTLVVLLTPVPHFGRSLIRLYGGTGDDSEERIYGLLMREQYDHTQSFADKCVQVAFKLDIPCVNVWKGMHSHPNWQREYFCDEGLHLNRREETAMSQTQWLWCCQTKAYLPPTWLVIPQEVYRESDLFDHHVQQYNTYMTVADPQGHVQYIQPSFLFH